MLKLFGGIAMSKEANSDIERKSLYLDGMMGLVVGDALGVPVEFSSREEREQDPVNEMRGYGTYPVAKGSWSDDSSMAIYDYMKSKDVSTCGQRDENSNGNGSLMRILPICIYLKYMQDEGKIDDAGAVENVHDMSALTHAHIRSKMACGIYFFCVRELAERRGKISELLQKAVDLAFSFYEKEAASNAELGHFERIRDVDSLKGIPEGQIKSGGYVIESIEAALWCMLNTSSYEECVLKAVNLGHDTDTTAAIAGGLAGIYYGYDAIPEEWKHDIIRRQCMEDMCKAM